MFLSTSVACKYKTNKCALFTLFCATTAIWHALSKQFYISYDELGGNCIDYLCKTRCKNAHACPPWRCTPDKSYGSLSLEASCVPAALRDIPRNYTSPSSCWAHSGGSSTCSSFAPAAALPQQYHSWGALLGGGCHTCLLHISANLATDSSVECSG